MNIFRYMLKVKFPMKINVSENNLMIVFWHINYMINWAWAAKLTMSLILITMLYPIKSILGYSYLEPKNRRKEKHPNNKAHWI